jgi:hypothetical protein
MDEKKGESFEDAKMSDSAGSHHTPDSFMPDFGQEPKNESGESAPMPQNSNNASMAVANTSIKPNGPVLPAEPLAIAMETSLNTASNQGNSSSSNANGVHGELVSVVKIQLKAPTDPQGQLPVSCTTTVVISQQKPAANGVEKHMNGVSKPPAANGNGIEHKENGKTEIPAPVQRNDAQPAEANGNVNFEPELNIPEQPKPVASSANGDSHAPRENGVKAPSAGQSS